MYNVLLKFTFENAEDIDDEQPGWLVSGFYKNGQLADYYHIPHIQHNILIYTAVILHPDAFDIKYHRPSAIDDLQRYKEEQLFIFEYEIIGERPSLLVTNLNEVSAFILHQGGLSPIRTLDTFANVPLYLLPKTSESKDDYHNIIGWQNSYESIERLWFRGSVDEAYFYDQLTNYKSALSLHSMEICQQITRLTGIDSYFHLFRDMNPDVPDFEYCPKCNSPWKMEAELFDTFKYKCDNCFLIS